MAASAQNNKAMKQVLLPSLLINLLSLAVPLTVLQIYDRILPNQSYGTASLLIAGACLALVMESLIRYVRSWILAAAASNTERRTYLNVLNKLSQAQPNALRVLGAGGVEEGLDSVSKVKDWYSGGMAASFIDLPFAVIFLALVAYLGGELVLVPISVWLVTFLIVWLSALRSRRLGDVAADKDKHRKAFLLLLSRSLQSIKRQAVESRIFSQFKVLNHDRSISRAKQESQNALAQECIQLAALATSVTLVIVGSLWVLGGELTTGGLAACSILSGRAVAPLSALVGFRIKLNSISSAKEAIAAIESLPSSAEPAKPGPFAEITVNELQVIRYQQVYQVNFVIKPGELVLLQYPQRHICGALLCALAGVDQAHQGQVIADGKALNDASLQPYAAYCSGKGQLIAGTLLDNLCGFEPARTERAQYFATALGLNKVITRLADGLETKIGHTPSNPLSQGQIKLLNIAAQLASDKPIVILDKPDVSLDLDAMANLTQVLTKELAAGRSFIMVSHHPQLQALKTQNRVVTAIEEGATA